MKNEKIIVLATFDEAWEYCEKIGIPIEVITKEQYDNLLGKETKNKKPKKINEKQKN